MDLADKSVCVVLYKICFYQSGRFEQEQWPWGEQSCRIVVNSLRFSLRHRKGRVVDLNVEVIIHSEIARLAFIWGKYTGKKPKGKHL